jgi:Uncharacterised nucleotidyltransferase
VTAADLLLLQLIRREWDASSGQTITIASDADWTAIIQAALHHGVAGLLCRSLRRLPPGEIAPDILHAAGVYIEESDARGAERVAQLFEILDVLAGADIPAIPFKGAALGVLAYGSATLRPSRDIDVLVHKQDMDRTVAALHQLQYRLGEIFTPRIMAACFETYGQDILFAEGRLPLEPHWSFSPKALAVDLDIDGLWDRASPSDLAGRVTLTLSPEDTLLVACLHGSKEKWWRLLWVADIAAFIHRHPTLDWDVTIKRAEASGIRRMLLLGLALARELFSSPLPPNLSSAIEQDPMCNRLVEESKRYLFTPGAAVGSVHNVSKYHLQLRERVGDRVRYAWRTVTTPQVMHYRMVKLPDALLLGYIPVKLVHDYLLLPLWTLGKGHWWRRSRNSMSDNPA